MSSLCGLKWQHWLMVAGGAAACGGLLYYLSREDTTEKDGAQASRLTDIKGKLSLDQISQDDVLNILQGISKSQDEMKIIMKDLTKEIISQHLTFEQTCKRVKQVQPEDPLERHGVSMQAFDQLLEKHQNDSSVREAITKIMGAPTPGNMTTKAQTVTKDSVVQVHNFMLKQLSMLVGEFEKLPDKSTFEMKTVTIAAQAIVGARVEEEFGLTSDDIESAALLHHQALLVDPEFARINVQMQTTMSQLMG